eukprot:TRINITY_DN4217_c0_g2_i1.p1 TRINITY_DN4217_c0_g2~~TRINITY_DN4217_c0_g2_i1.p1  ORF type:complete len:449 (+),score=-79.55 TRINITY_DN4217_c0_g2_i1:564-1910(+)
MKSSLPSVVSKLAFLSFFFCGCIWQSGSMFLLVLLLGRVSVHGQVQFSPGDFGIKHKNVTLFAVSKEDRCCKCETFEAQSDILVGNVSLLARIETLEKLVAMLIANQTEGHSKTSGSSGWMGSGTTTAGRTTTGTSSTGTTSTSSTSMGNGALFAWGYNSNGQLGDGTITDRYDATAVLQPEAWTRLNVMAIATGDFHSMALLSSGALYAWGYNDKGQLGDGTTVSHNAKAVMPPEWIGLNVKAIAAGSRHSLALLSDGTLYSWGSNAYGQLGDGTTTDRYNVTAVVQPATWTGLNVTAIAAGFAHSMALLSNGTLFSWGFNEFGQLGDGTTTDRYIAVVVQPETWTGLRVTAITAGSVHSMALLSNGALYAWGKNDLFQLGDGTNKYRYNATAVMQPPTWIGLKVTAIAAGNQHSMALLSNGALYTLGYNMYGRLGDGTGQSRTTKA